MTQEELDVLISGAIDDIGVLDDVAEDVSAEQEETTLAVEEKASEIFDIIEVISNNMMDKEVNVQKSIDIFSANIKLFTTLTTKFPDVEAFKTALTQNEEALVSSNETLEVLQTSGDSIMNVMDIMQYQDIHRQKIEHDINVMHALTKYMNTLFEGKIDDENCVSSAQDKPSDNDIEALLAQFEK